MSCGQPPPEEDLLEEPEAAPASTACARCQRPAAILLRHVGHCTDCFLANFRNKFNRGTDSARVRSRTGSAEEVAQGVKRGRTRSKVMLGFSGGPASRALLDLFIALFPSPEHPSQNNPRFKPPPLFEEMIVAYIDESGVPGFGDDRTEEVRQIVTSTTLFTFVPLKLESVFDSSAPLSTSLSTPSLVSTKAGASTSASSSDPLASLRALLSPTKHTTTSIASLHSSLLQSLLRRTASQLGCDILFTAETATRIAIRTIAGMSEGRGWSMGEEVAGEWISPDGVMCVRPLCIVLAKEVAFWNRLREIDGLKGVVRPETGVEAKKAGIEALTSEFILNLEANFPSTVSTVLRTAQKLGMRSYDATERGQTQTSCPLCGLPAQDGADGWRQAITISSFASDASADPTLATHTDKDQPLSLSAYLCYSCLLVCQGTKPSRDATDAAELVFPGYVGDMARRRNEEHGAVNVAGEQGEVVGVRVKGKEEAEEMVKGFLLED